MTTKPDNPSDESRPVAALAGQFLHQRVAYRSPGPGGRIDELDDDAGATLGDAIPPDQSDQPEEEDAG